MKHSIKKGLNIALCAAMLTASATPSVYAYQKCGFGGFDYNGTHWAAQCAWINNNADNSGGVQVPITPVNATPDHLYAAQAAYNSLCHSMADNMRISIKASCLAVEKIVTPNVTTQDVPQWDFVTYTPMNQDGITAIPDHCTLLPTCGWYYGPQGSASR